MVSMGGISTWLRRDRRAAVRTAMAFGLGVLVGVPAAVGLIWVLPGGTSAVTVAAGDARATALTLRATAASPSTGQLPPAADLPQTGLPSWLLMAVIPGAVLVLGGTATVIALRRSVAPPKL